MVVGELSSIDPFNVSTGKVAKDGIRDRALNRGIGGAAT